ncbi:MAG: DUF2490 domain-containing protein [Pyrinomonadaceae bacterium]
MKKHCLIIVATILFFSHGVFSQNPPPEADVQFWNETSLTFPLLKTTDGKGKKSNRIEGFITGNLRIGQNIQHFVDERIGGGINYIINKNFSASVSYLYIAEQPYKGARRGFENRLRFDFNAEKKWKSFSLKDRNRIEYRIRNSRSDSTRYRNKIQLKVPINRDGSEIVTPFVATEPFYDFSQSKWSRNEFSAGISKKLHKTLTAEFFYMLQTNTGTVLKRRNIVGANLKFKID